MMRASVIPQRMLSTARRVLAAEAAQAQEDTLGQKLSVMPNGLKVATINPDAAGARVMFLVNTGSRDDTHSSLGLTHCLQAASGLNGSKNTAFLTTQLTAALGADLHVSADREHLLYSVKCHPNVVKDVITEVIIPAILSPTYAWWDLKNLGSAMKYQKAVAETEPLFLLSDAAHKASFRSGLSNPVLSPESMIGKHTSEMALSRFGSAFTSGNMTLAGSGMDQDALIGFASTISESLTGGSGLKRTASEFVSKEVHVDHAGAMNHSAINFEGVSLNDADALAASVLQHALGTQSNIKRASGLTHGVLNSAIAETLSCPFSTSASSLNYSDAGLFTVHVVAGANDIAAATIAASAQCARIASEGLDAATVEAAKARAKSTILMAYENAEFALEASAVQASVTGSFASKAKLAALIDAVTADDVSAVAKKVLGGRKSLATLGNPCNVPILQDLL